MLRGFLKLHLDPATRAAIHRRLEQVRCAGIRVRSRLLRAPGLRRVRAAQLRRLRPLWDGRVVGTSVIRHYWTEYLEAHRADIRGRGLEIGSVETIRRYGGDALTRAEALDLTPHGSLVTVVADLSRADHVPSDAYDSFVNQFSMHMIYDAEAALFHSVRILAPGGVLLVNFPCLDYYFGTGLEMGTGRPLYSYWWYTPTQVRCMLHRIGVSSEDYHVTVYGNLLTRVAYLLNLPAEELTPAELRHQDPGQPLLVCARVQKPPGWRGTKPEYREPGWTPTGEPLRWNPVTIHYGNAYTDAPRGAAGRG